MKVSSVKYILLIVFITITSIASVHANIEVTYKQIDANNFPFVFSTVGVTENGLPLDGLNVSHFTVTEDGRVQTDFLEVIPPSESGGSRLADIVFLIDNSGSMGSEISAVRNNVNAFANALEAQGVDYRLGAVRFGNWSGSNPGVLGGGNLTGDLAVFHSWINSMSASGWYEPGLQAITMAATTFNFRPGSTRHFLIITDEDSDGGSLSSAISLCQANNIVVHAAVNCNFGSSQAHYCAANTSISGATNGHVFPVAGPYNQILTDILSYISDTYIVRYKTDNPAYDGLEREVEITVNYQSQTNSDIAYYTPGAGPSIERTAATIQFSSTPQVQDYPLTFAANIVDNVPPGVTNAKLYYRVTGTTNYASLNLVHQSGTLYSVVLPGNNLQYPGLDYYLTATDGQLTSSAPPVDPGLGPYSIAVLPNVKPLIIHTPVTEGLNNTAIPIIAEVIDGTHFVAEVKLRYKKIGQLLYRNLIMTNTGGNNYSGEIPADFATYDGVRYKIEAKDDLGSKTTHGPHEINVPKDSDGDGLLDEWEINGYDADGDGIPDLDLWAMGARPDHKDIFVEIDWMAEDCVLFFCHTHQPSIATLEIIMDAFADMPISNPDGIDGINIILDAGAYGGGEEIPHQNNINLPGDFDAIKNTYFPSNREHIFHYCVFAHRYNNGTSSGSSFAIPNSDFIVTLGSSSNKNAAAGTFIHELGHNLGMRHGGFDNSHYKPNYLSVMNYHFQFGGVNINGRQEYSYSYWVLPSLDENHLDETVGINAGSSFDNWGTAYYCGTTKKTKNNLNDHINWNCDYDPFWPFQDYDVDITANINNNPKTSSDDNDFDVLHSHNDLTSIDFEGGTIGARQNKSAPDTTGLDELTWDDLANDVPYPVSLFDFTLRFGAIGYTWIPLYEHIDSNLMYEIIRVSSQGDTSYTMIMDSVYSDSSFVSATEYKMSIRAKTEYDVFSEVSDTLYHTTYQFEKKSKVLDLQFGLQPVNQDATAKVSFELKDIQGAPISNGRYIYTLRRYVTARLIEPVHDEAEIISVPSDLLETATHDPISGKYHLNIDCAGLTTGYWGGRLLIDDGTIHHFGFEVIAAEDDEPTIIESDIE